MLDFYFFVLLHAIAFITDRLFIIRFLGIREHTDGPDGIRVFSTDLDKELQRGESADPPRFAADGYTIASHTALRRGLPTLRALQRMDTWLAWTTVDDRMSADPPRFAADGYKVVEMPRP